MQDGLVLLILKAHLDISLTSADFPCYPLLLLRFWKHHMRRHTFQPSTSDTRQARQSSQPAGSVADISHLGSKSQENKPLENMVHETLLRREVRQQETKHSSQENELQETKHTVALPVLIPKYSSIQPTSGPVSPPDQPFKPQEATCAPFHTTYVFSKGS